MSLLPPHQVFLLLIGHLELVLYVRIFLIPVIIQE